MQQFKKDEETRPIKRAGVIRPKDPVTVYVTAKVASHKSNGFKLGDSVELHRVTAERWIATGKGAKTKKEAMETSGETEKSAEGGADKK